MPQQAPSLRRHRQQGISLVEIMVAMVISLLLILGVSQIYIGSKASYQMNEGLARVQEAGRFATDHLSRAVRMAGFQGCMNRAQLEPNVIATGVPADVKFAPEDVVTGVDDVAAGTQYGGVDVRPGTDVLEIRRAAPVAAKLTGNMAADNANIQVTGNPDNFRADDVLFITDCADADLFRATTVSQASGKTTIAHANSTNTTNRLSKPYRDNAMVMSFHSDRFFIGDTGRANAFGEPVFALYTQTVVGGALQNRPLLDGVENMQILYGEDTDNDGAADTYTAAGAVSDFSNVIAVRIALLVNSVDASLTEADAATYDLLGKSVTPGTRQLRKTFTLTAAVRNRELRSPSFGS